MDSVQQNMANCDSLRYLKLQYRFVEVNRQILVFLHVCLELGKDDFALLASVAIL